MLRRIGKTRSRPHEIADGLADRLEAVPVDERREIIVEVEQAIAIDVNQIGALPVRNVKRDGIFLHRGAGHTTGENRHCATE
ncbi:hypothetical protein D3C72_2377040 [compost metagenome]